MYNILCFGDSNTFGTNPAGGRWPWEQRWTGLLQNELGSSYRIIEDGCGGRTTGLDDPIEGDRNGLRHLGVSLHSHRPLDLVILMLGTNDMKHRFSLLPIDIAKSAARLGELVQQYAYGPAYPVPKVLLVSPILLGEGVSHSIYTGFTEDGVEVSRQLAPLYEEQARLHGWQYLDAARYAGPSAQDHLHMEAADHAALARAMAEAVREALK